MNVTDALLDRKNLTEEIKRLKAISSSHFTETIPKGKTLENVSKEEGSNVVLFNDIDAQINKIEGELELLRERMLKTNVSKYVKVDNDDITLSRLKIKIDTIKSRLSHLMGLRSDSKRYGRMISSTDDEERNVQQLSDLELEERIKELERVKTRYQQILDKANASTELVE